MTSSPSTSAIVIFAKDLREAREFQQMTLEEAARATRISLDYLEALESGQWDQIPRAYLRGYLALFAEAVGMNREKVLRGFDNLHSAHVTASGAVLDETQPLLRQPEHMGVTRAKIRTTWFADLSHNRRAFYLLTLVAVIGLLGLLRLTRTYRPSDVSLTPFENSVAENLEKVHSPLTIIPLQDSLNSGQSRFAAKVSGWTEWVGTKDGRVVVRRDQAPPISFRYMAYDTVKIQYLNDISGKVVPRGSMTVYKDTTRLTPEQATKSDTDVYIITLRQIISSDSSTIYRPSL
jgi:hypothetical protein